MYPEVWTVHTSELYLVQLHCFLALSQLLELITQTPNNFC